MKVQTEIPIHPEVSSGRTAGFPIQRPRRLRLNAALRGMVRETELNPRDFIYPLFVRAGHGSKTEIHSMPGVYQWSVDGLAAEAEAIARLGIPAVIFFGIPAEKDAIGLGKFRRGRCRPAGDPRDQASRPRTDRGHRCVPVRVHRSWALRDPERRRDAPERSSTRRLRAQRPDPRASRADRRVARRGGSGYRRAERDDGRDGRGDPRRAGGRGFEHIAILSYAVKYASSFYGPFREAAEGAPRFGDRKSHQMDPANAREALREAALDVAEGADMLMVKPALPYLDILHRVREQFPSCPWRRTTSAVNMP